MSKEEKIKSLGFQDEQEMLLYQDVCCGDLPISEPDSLEELYDSLNSDDLFDGYKKEEYEKYIINHGLVDLFNRVRNMTLFNRMVEIYVYYANGLSICKNVGNVIQQKIKEAKELFDGEKEQEYNEQSLKILRMRREYSEKMEYIEKQVRLRLPSEEAKFYETIKDVDITVLSTGEENRNKGIKK